MKQNEELQRNIYLRNVATGQAQGPLTGYPSKDKPWLKYYPESSLEVELPDKISTYEYMKNKNIKNPNRIAINYYGNTIHLKIYLIK